FLDDTNFYYEVPGQSACFGDSGGPAFLIRNRVERHAGVTSSGDESCHLDGDQARTDNPQIAAFLQPTIDEFEGNDPCRNDEACNVHKQLVDPDCAENHCGPDGICVLSCVAPLDPDCVPLGINHCIPDGVCDPGCVPLDPDCQPLCGQEGTCIPGCAQDPDCQGFCGDGILQPGEACDDGNAVSGDGCEPDCTLSCGNGILDAGEEGDDGNQIDPDACRNNCVAAFCGDGVVGPGEDCDDGNAVDDDACSNTCKAARCGDGIVNGNDQCDDGNTTDGDGC